MRYKGANITFIALHSSRLLKIHNKEDLRDKCLSSCCLDMLYMPLLVYLLYNKLYNKHIAILLHIYFVYYIVQTLIILYFC